MNKDIFNYLMMQYRWSYKNTKDWDSEVDMIRLRNINKLTKQIYAESLTD